MAVQVSAEEASGEGRGRVVVGGVVASKERNVARESFWVSIRQLEEGDQ